MVFFNCNACGESVKKNQVEKHYQFKCRSCNVLSCVDCGKDFWGDDYKTHVKCMTEDEKYGGKDYKARPGANKGERKQEQWTMQVQEAITKCSNPKLKGLLQRIEDHPNIPRKKAKFENFLKNSMRIPVHFITQMWEAINAELVKAAPATAEDKSPDVNGQSPESCEETSAERAGEAKKLTKRERKEERKKLKHRAEKKDKRNEDEEKEEDMTNKKKKRKREDDEEEKTEDVVVKKKKKKKSKSAEDEESEQDKEEGAEAVEDANGSIVEDTPKVKFNWENTIIAVLKTQGDHEISVKKLRKKVLAEYHSCSGDKVYNEDKLLSKFNKKISKNRRFRVLKDRVKLLS